MLRGLHVLHSTLQAGDDLIGRLLWRVFSVWLKPVAIERAGVFGAVRDFIIWVKEWLGRALAVALLVRDDTLELDKVEGSAVVVDTALTTV